MDWEFNLETEIIVFTLDAETIGFVGFGISMNPNMAGADIVIGGVRNGQAYFQVNSDKLNRENFKFQSHSPNHPGLSCDSK